MDVGAYLCSPSWPNEPALNSLYRFCDPPMSPGVGQLDGVVPLAGWDDPPDGLTFRLIRQYHHQGVLPAQRVQSQILVPVEKPQDLGISILGGGWGRGVNGI